MGNVFFTSDWHIGHRGIATRFRKRFVTDDHHDDYVLSVARAHVTKRDMMFVVGDVTWTQAGLQKIKDADFPCRMIMVGGNHDTLHIRDYLQVFDNFHGALKYKEFFITHIPMHRQELYRCNNIHGHCHRGGPWETNQEKEYYNAILEFNDYRPVSLQEVRKEMETRSL